MEQPPPLRRCIAVVTGSRAEFGILRWVIEDIHADPALDLALIVTGSHLSAAHGLTVSEIEATGLPIAARVPIDLSDDSPAHIARAMGQGLTGMVDALSRLKPDMMLVLGDRYEIFAAVQAAMLARVPVAHIAGGDVTEGAIDDAMRHAITKMAHLHFATNAESAARIHQMGEDAARIFMVGNPALDQLRRMPLMDRAELEESLGAALGRSNILMTFHPVTLAGDWGLSELDSLLAVLAEQPQDSTIWITRSNADTGGAQVNARIDAWADGRANVHVYTSLGLPRYMALLAQCDLVIGNSSSGLYEAPSFGTPTVNIGARQGGRLSANSVFACSGTADEIRAAMLAAAAFDRKTAINPYGDGQSAARIVAALKSAPNSAQLLHKQFARIEG